MARGQDAKEKREKRFLPCLNLAVIGHGAREFVVEHLQGGNVCKGGVEKIASQGLVANVTDVVVPEKDTAAKVIDTLHGGDTEALDAPQEILEGYQIPEMLEIPLQR